jgi:hypothetical protein
MSSLNAEITGRRRSGGAQARQSRKKARAPPEFPLTLSVPEAGRRYFDMSKNASYAAAARGEIPTVKVGKLLRVPVRAMERILEAACRLPAAE